MGKQPTVISDLEDISDPIQRAQSALLAMEDARSLMERIAQTRARAVYQVYQAYGGAKAARLLGISRVNLYRVLGQVPEVHERRVQTALEVSALLVAAGHATTAEQNLEGGVE